MKNYYQIDDSLNGRSQRLLLLSLMLILLSLFVFLTSFTESDKKKIEIFKKHFNTSIMFSGKGNTGKDSLTEFGNNSDPIIDIVKKMKSNNINRKLMVKYLTLKEIKDMDVYKGINGIVLVLPEVIRFRKDRMKLDFTARKYLSKILFLVKNLPYEVEIRGYSSKKNFVSNVKDDNYGKILKDSALRAMLVYDYFIGNGVSPAKLFVSGYGDSIKKKMLLRIRLKSFLRI
jgi:outer membrane protein OmpA-like peptidoglycan-associated protein